MSKKVNWLPNVRVDIPDLSHGTSGYVESVSQETFDLFVKDNYSRVAEGFRVVIADQGTSPGLFTVYNGAALDQDGTLITNQEDTDAQRSSTITSDATYYVEVELLETESDVASRAVWDPTFDNGADASGDLLPAGKEFPKNVATRITKDWTIVTPISTSGFDISTDANSNRIPVAVLVVAGGVISGASTAAARTCLLESCTVGATELKMVSTKIFPDAFTATLDVGGANSETVTVTANDRKNGILTISGGTANAQTAGARLVNATAGAPQFLTERTAMTPAVATAAGDARMRLWQASEDRGYVLGQSPLAATGNSDSQISSLKDQIDFLAAQIREAKFGFQRAADAGLLPPPDTFTSEPRWFDRAPGAAGAKTLSITVGDGLSQWGDLNRTAFASDDLLLEAAIAALPVGGGTVFIKPGFTLDNFAAAVTVPADTVVRFASDNNRNKLVVNIDATDVTTLFACASGTTYGKIAFDNITLSSDNASPMFVQLEDNWDLEIVNSAFIADSGGAVAMFDYTGVATTPGRTIMSHSSLQYTSAGLGGADGLAFVDATDIPIDNFFVNHCDFTFSNVAGGGATVDRLFYINDWRHDINFLSSQFVCTDLDGGDCTAIHVATTDSTGINDENRIVALCNFTVTNGTMAGTNSTITGMTTWLNTGERGVVNWVDDSVTLKSSLSVATGVTAAVYDGGDVTDGDLDLLSLDVGATGITSDGPIVLSSGEHVTVSGTGRYKHGDMQIVVPSAMFTPYTDTMSAEIGYDTGSGVGTNTFGHWLSGTNGGKFMAPLYLPVGARVKSVVISLYVAVAGHTKTFNVGSTETATDNVTVIATDDSGIGTGVVAVTATPSGSGHTLLSTRDYWLEIDNIWIGDYIKSALVTYDFP